MTDQGTSHRKRWRIGPTQKSAREFSAYWGWDSEARHCARLLHAPVSSCRQVAEAQFGEVLCLGPPCSQGTLGLLAPPWPGNQS